eukprot:jgi/Tetstr1/434187/TSEL_023298.t1
MARMSAQDSEGSSKLVGGVRARTRGGTMSSAGRIVPRMSKSKLREKRGQVVCQTWRILRGDTVYINTGKDKGLTGTVTKVIRDIYNPRVIVEGRNMVWKHVKMEGSSDGGKIRIPAPIQYSNVMLIDPVSGGPVRVKMGFAEDGSKVRISVGKHATGSAIPRPAVLAERAKPRNPPSIKDTPADVVAKVTYSPETMVEDFKSFAAKVLGQPSYPRFKYPPLELESLPVRSRTGQDQGLLPIAASEALRLRPKARLAGKMELPR